MSITRENIATAIQSGNPEQMEDTFRQYVGQLIRDKALQATEPPVSPQPTDAE